MPASGAVIEWRSLWRSDDAAKAINGDAPLSRYDNEGVPPRQCPSGAAVILSSAMTTLTPRQQAALEQMGIRPVALRRPKVPLALIHPADMALEQTQLARDLLLLLEQSLEQCPVAHSENEMPAHRYWVMGTPRPGSATHLFTPRLDKPLNVDDKRRIWRSLQRWL